MVRDRVQGIRWQQGVVRLIRYALSAKRGDFAETYLIRAHARQNVAASRRWQVGREALLWMARL